MSKTVNLSIGIFVVLLITSAVITLIILNAPSTQSPIIPAQCQISNPSATTSGSYKCPSDSSSCNIVVELSCNSKVTSPKVLLRWSDENSPPREIAVDHDGDGDLDRWIYDGAQLSNNAGAKIVSTTNDFIQEVRSYNGRVAVCFRTSTNNLACRYYNSGGSISTDSASSTAYAGKELLSGSVDSYQCSQQVTGSVTKTVAYSGSSAGTKTESFTLSKDQSINWNGKITYQTTKTQNSQCTQNKKGTTAYTYYECKTNQNGCGVLSTTETTCPNNLIYKEDLQKCDTPYTVKLTLEKQVYAVGEKINGQIELSDTNKKDFIDSTLTIRNVLGEPKGTAFASTNSRGIAIFSFNGLPLVGDYRLTIDNIEHPDGSIPVTLSFKVSQPIELRLTPYPDQIQYTSEPIRAKAYTTDSQGQAKDSKSWDLSGTVCGNKDLSKDVQVQRLGRTDQGTEYLLSANVNEECTMTFKAVAIDDSGYRSPADAITIDVRESEILIKPELTSIQDKDAGRHTIQFKTLDPNLQLADTTNSVIIRDSDACESGKFCLIDNKNIPEVTVGGSNGEYQFTHNFKDGLNTIIITSSSTKGLQSTTQEFTINLFPSSTQDPIGGDDDGDGGLTAGFWITGIIALLSILFFLWIIFGKKRN